MERKNTRNRDARRNLLILMSEELRHDKKFCRTKINSKTLKRAEEEYSVQNDQIINLKTEIFSSSRLKLTDITFCEKKFIKSFESCNNLKKKIKIPLLKFNSLSFKGNEPDTTNTSIIRSQMDSDNLLMKISNTKTSISFRKNQFFRQNTLNKIENDNKNLEVIQNFNFNNNINGNNESLDEQKNLYFQNKNIMNKVPRNEVDITLDLIFNDNSSFKNKSTMHRAKKGFSFLQKLSSKLKIRPKIKHSMIGLYIGMKEMLNIQDEIDLNELDSSNEYLTENHDNCETSLSVMFDRDNIKNINENETLSFKNNPSLMYKFKNNFRQRNSCNLEKNLTKKSLLTLDQNDKNYPEIPNYKGKILHKSFEYDTTDDFSIKLNRCDQN